MHRVRMSSMPAPGGTPWRHPALRTRHVSHIERDITDAVHGAGYIYSHGDAVKAGCGTYRSAVAALAIAKGT